MGRKRLVVPLAAAAAVFVSAATEGLAQGPAQPATGPASKGAEPGNGARPQLQPARPPQQLRVPPQAAERWRAMSLEDRQRFNPTQSAGLSSVQTTQCSARKGSIPSRTNSARSEEALARSGLQLEAEKREAWERQYQQERKKIERTLRQELEEKRQRELAPVVERLKKEFGQGQSPSASNGTSSPSPKK